MRSFARNLPSRTPDAMPIALIVAAAVAAQSAGSPPEVYGPAPPAQSKPAPPPVRPASSGCSPAVPDPKSSEIIVCAPKPQGYRIDPDVLAAHRAKKEARAGRPRPPENLKDHSCAVVGPAPCIGAPVVDVLAAAGTLAEMAARLSKGQEIGSMFITDPQPSEYELYLAAKKLREEKEDEAAAKALAAKAKASDPSAPAKPGQ